MAIVEPWTPGDGGREPDVVSGGRTDAGPHGSGAAPGRRFGRVGRAIALVVAVLVLLSAVIWIANRRVGRSEFSAVLRCVQTSERTLTEIDSQLAVTGNYVAPQVGPQSSLLLRDNLYRLIEDAADDALPDLDDALSGCDSVSIAPLYHRLTAARAAYVGYLAAQVSHLHDISRDGTAQFRPAPDLPPLLAAARTELAAAAPDSSDRRQVDTLLRAS